MSSTASTAKIKEAQTALPVGSKVTVKGKNKGVVKFVGTTKYGAGVWVGVELEKPKGTHDGALDGQRYFTCKAEHGVYALYDEVQPLKFFQKAMGALGSLGSAMTRTSKSPERSDKVTDHRRAFMAWNAMDMDAEALHHEQAATQERVEAILRASHPHAAQLPNEISATTLANACGMSLNFLEWGDDMEIEESYEGPHLEFPVNAQNIAVVLHQIRANPDYSLHKKYVAKLLGHNCHLLADQKGVEYITVPEGGKVVVFGDTHGQLADFLLVLSRHGPPGDKVTYVLNGDIADRGDNSLEIFVIVLMYKLLYPTRVYINRGNHENHDINRKPAESGGGFYDEVIYKMEGTIFLMFQILFETLPLICVINKQVAVMHGGIPRIEGLTLDRISSINRKRQCPKVVQSPEDAILFDLMWADPQEAKGISMAAQRGPNCRKFGPDVTKRFLSDNALSLCIRSHEVPTSLRGFEERHDRRLLTVFTASNYCGMAGNYGAIVVFDSDMSYTLEEHMAPDLDTMILEYNKTAKPPPQAPKALTKKASMTKRTRETTSNLAQSRDKMNEEVLAKLEQKICQHKDELWWFWKESDVDDTGCIPVGRWRQGMSTMLHLDIPWHSLEDELARPDADGIVDYRDFLHRIRNNAMAQGLKSVDGGWEKQMVVKVYETIIRSDMTLKQAISEFDIDGDGKVSAWEFRKALQVANADIPETQATALLRMIERDGKALDVASFFDRFQVIYSKAAEQGLSGAESATGRRVREMLTRVGRRLFQFHGNSRMKLFEQVDTSGDGFVQEDEFYAMLNSLDLSPPLSADDRKDMWRYIDANADGHLNYFEFCAAFQVVDVDADDGAVADIVETIVSTLQRNMSSLEFAFRFFDQKGQGHIPVEDFKAGIRALNSSIQSAQGRTAPLSEEQIEVLVQHVDKDGDGLVDYTEFCSAFRPKDGRFMPRDDEAGGKAP